MSIKQHIPLVLASSSPIRAQMLKNLGLQFSVVPAMVDEAAIKAQMQRIFPNHLALALAKTKAMSVAGSYPDAITLGADQVCFLPANANQMAVKEPVLLSKPVTAEKACDQLRQLAGKVHRQVSAACLARGQEVLWADFDFAKLTMRALTEEDIKAYVAADQPLQSCGSYKYESLGKHLFSEIKGEDAVIMGLPIIPILNQLYQLGAISLA